MNFMSIIETKFGLFNILNILYLNIEMDDWDLD